MAFSCSSRKDSYTLVYTKHPVDEWALTKKERHFKVSIDVPRELIACLKRDMSLGNSLSDELET